MQRKQSLHQPGQDPEEESSELGDPWDNMEAAFGRRARVGDLTDESGQDEVEEEWEEWEDDEEADSCSSEEPLEAQSPPPAPYDDAETRAKQLLLDARHRELDRRRAALHQAMVLARQQSPPLDVKRLAKREQKNREDAGVLLGVRSVMPELRQQALTDLRHTLSRPVSLDLPRLPEVDRAARDRTREIADPRVLRALTAHLDLAQLLLPEYSHCDVWTLETPTQWVVVGQSRVPPPEDENDYVFYIVVARDALKL